MRALSIDRRARPRSRFALAMAAFLASLVAVPGSAMADASGIDTSACSSHQLAQPFLADQDFNWYAYAPGMSAAGVDPAGWTLSGGAKIVPVTLPGKVIAGVLNMPSGSTAVSPVMCVSSDYQLARAQIRNLTADGGGGVALSVSYQGDSGWSSPVRGGNLASNDTAWGLSAPAKLPPAATSGWQLVRLTLTSTTNGKGFQVKDLAAQASTQLALDSVDTSSCRQHELSQALMGGNDFNWYAPAPGMSAAGVDGSGWTLSGGATIVQTQLADGQTGTVLNLPNKAKAVSPFMCVSSDYQVARAQIRNLTAGSVGGVTLAAAIKGTTTWNNPKTSTLYYGGNDTAWRLSNTANLQPADAEGTQLVQITLTSTVSGGKGYQVYGLAARSTTKHSLDAVDTSDCSAHGLSQPFLSSGDSSWYATAPGESTDTFDGSGWTLSAGANIVSTQLADGAYGGVLDLPAGARAVSPLMCISSDYQLARAQIRRLTAGAGGVTLAAEIDGTTTWNSPKTSNLGGNDTAWGVSSTANLQPADESGWQLVRITLTNTSSTAEYQVSNLAAQASASLALSSVDTSACVPQDFAQAFLWAGDQRWYTPAPGVSSAGFLGTGWTLSGGASIKQAQMADGSVAPVLDLPPGSQAIAPVMCVTSDYPMARARLRQVDGDGSVSMFVSYQGTTSWNNPTKSADIKGPKGVWGLSGAANINPGKSAGWQLVQITLTATDNNHTQIVDFQVDPRCK
jgi:hypothetical protein